MRFVSFTKTDLLLFKMKRLLLPLLAALALPTAVYAGNLGLADKILNGVNATKLEETKQIYDINVGQINGKATAEFANGKFIIKTDEKYIKKMQKEGRLLLVRSYLLPYYLPLYL